MEMICGWFCLQLFVGWILSYLCYMCLFAHSGVQHILCCVFVSFFFVLYCQCFWVVHFLLSLQNSLTFIQKTLNKINTCLLNILVISI